MTSDLLTNSLFSGLQTHGNVISKSDIELLRAAKNGTCSQLKVYL